MPPALLSALRRGSAAALRGSAAAGGATAGLQRVLQRPERVFLPRLFTGPVAVYVVLRPLAWHNKRIVSKPFCNQNAFISGVTPGSYEVDLQGLCEKRCSLLPHCIVRSNLLTCTEYEGGQKVRSAVLNLLVQNSSRGVNCG